MVAPKFRSQATAAHVQRWPNYLHAFFHAIEPCLTPQTAYPDMRTCPACSAHERLSTTPTGAEVGKLLSAPVPGHAVNATNSCSTLAIRRTLCPNRHALCFNRACAQWQHKFIACACPSQHQVQCMQVQEPAHLSNSVSLQPLKAHTGLSPRALAPGTYQSSARTARS